MKKSPKMQPKTEELNVKVNFGRYFLKNALNAKIYRPYGEISPSLVTLVRPDFRVPNVHMVNCVEDTTNDEHVRHLQLANNRLPT
jgi:hypothetical protein